MESHEASFPLFPRSLEIPWGLPHSHGMIANPFKHQIPPLRCASVGMTNYVNIFRDRTLQGTTRTCHGPQLKPLVRGMLKSHHHWQKRNSSEHKLSVSSSAILPPTFSPLSH